MRRYATIADIETRWRTLTEAEKPRAQALIDDATAIVFGMGAADDGSPARFAALRSTIANMVIRAMSASDSLHGVTQYSQSVGAVSESWQMANPNGDLYLTRQEKRALHIGTSRAWHGTIGGAHAESGCDMHCLE